MMKSPVNSIANDLEVTKLDYLAKLRQKYDTSKQDREVVILEEKYQKKKQPPAGSATSPELITIDDPIIHR